jgi:bacillithiol biosynthesis cysteine-adding enzyme BshC
MRLATVPGVRLSPSPLVDAFLHDFNEVAPLYVYDWSQQASFQARADWLRSGGYQGDRRALAAALERYNRALGADEAALQNARLLGEEGTLAVVTGQQAGLLTGPAYAVYKALTAIHLARVQSEELGAPVVPVFWMAGEDHDWPEHASVLVPTANGTQRLQFEESFEGDRRSVGLAPAPSSSEAVIEELAGLLPETEFKEEVLGRLREALAAPPALDPVLTEGRASLVDWAGRLMAWLTAGTGLVFLNSSDPALRQIEAPFFRRAIERFRAVDGALEEGFERLTSLGFTPTVERQPGNLNLFIYVQGERLPLIGDGDAFWVRGRESLRWTKAELLALTETDPARFSTNVVLRPVVQGYLLPDLAYVGGPGEIGYFGLYREVFAALDAQMPIVYPRRSLTLVEPPIARILEKQGLTLADVFFHLDEKRQEFLEREDRLGITERFTAFRHALECHYEELVTSILELDPKMRPFTEENRKQILFQVQKLEEKTRQEHRKNCEVLLRQFDRLKASLTPGGGLQERAVSFVPFLAKYGPDLARQILPLLAELSPTDHGAVFLGAQPE